MREVETWINAADLAARGEKVCEQEVKVEKEGSRRDAVATFFGCKAQPQ